MRVMVFDVAAESGGALSVLKDFYNEYKYDKNNEYIFVISKPKIKEVKNIKVLRYPWIKKSWFHRLYFDNFIAPKLIEEYRVDRVLSLQNIIIPRSKVKQTVYVHNCLPFIGYKFKFFENKLLWIYQNIIGKKILDSIKNSSKTIVQTNWMKNECVKKIGVDEGKIDVIPPKIEVEIRKCFEFTKKNLETFFYPASAVQFKNHELIVDACINLKKMGINNYKIILTLYGDENKHIKKLYKKVKDYELPIKFIGVISREETFTYYSKSVLIFPSYIETIGLPLLEAKLHKSPILVSDCLFAHEVLNNYENAYFFNPFKSNELSEKMKLILNIL